MTNYSFNISFAVLFNSEFWRNLNNVYGENDKLSKLLPSLRDTVMRSRETSTVKTYQMEFQYFVNWCKQTGQDYLSANSVIIGLYLTSLIQSRCSVSKINHAFYGINWFYVISNIKPNPCDDKFLLTVLEGCRRSVAKQIRKKEPINTDHIKLMANKFGTENADLKDLRLLSLTVLSFCGFLRFQEAINIRRSDIELFPSYCSIFIAKSKTDVYREGNKIIIARTNKQLTCPVTILERYWRKADIDSNSEEYIVRAIMFSSKQSKLVLRPHKYQALSYSTVRDLFHKALTDIGLRASDYGLHSLRAGGASASANAGTNDRLIKKQGRWVTNKAMYGYVKDDMKDLLSVSLNLGL